jgi:arginine/lysine/ornithine decarboxylase
VTEERPPEPRPSPQEAVPYLEELVRYAADRRYRFHTPGHIQGRGVHPLLLQAFGARTFDLDLCTGLGNLDGNVDSALVHAEQLAAEAWGAERTWFLINGSTAGNHTMLAATCAPGDTVLVSRNTHKSIVAALMMSGAVPAYIQAEIDPESHIAHGVTPAAVASALERRPEAKALLIVSPTYYGVCSDVAGIAEACHRKGVPLLVDEAWGPHFPFHQALPAHAISLGADAAVTSPHKLIGSLTQSAMLHVKGPLVDPDRFAVVLRMVQSTSPSCLLYAALDAARMQMATEGETLLQAAIGMAEDARTELNEHPRLHVIDKSLIGRYGVHAVDPTRLCVNVTGTGYTGYEVDHLLTAVHHVVVEMADFANVLANITIGHRPEDVTQLVRALMHIADVLHGGGPEPEGYVEHVSLDLPEQVMSPNGAFHARQERLPFERTAGRVSAELVASYPPGIPALVPGERVTAPLVEYLAAQVNAGCRMVGPEDPLLGTLRVVVE